MDTIVSIPTVVGDSEPHIFKFWGAEDIINPLLFYPTLNGTKMSLLVGRSGT